MKNSHKFFNNKDCKFFPCHEHSNDSDFNCLFCFCPLYSLGTKCGGNFTYSQKNNGIKNCTNCLVPHDYESYDMIITKLKTINNN